MKKIIVSFFLSVFLLSACNNGNEETNMLIGNWKLTEWQILDDNESFIPGITTFKKWELDETMFLFTKNGYCYAEGYFGKFNGIYNYGEYLDIYTTNIDNPQLIVEFRVANIANNELVLVMESNYYYKFLKQ